jgi:hypothetical protein
MKLDPVFLLAPPPVVTRRQALRAVGTTVAAGMGVGFLGGFLLSGRNAVVDTRLSDPLVSWASRLADDPRDEAVEELAQHCHGLRYALQAAPHCMPLWRGWARVAAAVTSMPQAQAADTAALLLQMYEGRPASVAVPRTDLLPRLRELAR